MNFYSISAIVCGFFLFSTHVVSAQVSGSDTTVTLHVSGECEQCKQRIETAATGRGVSAATWDVATEILTLTYNPARTSIEKVSNRIVAAGHDTGLKKAKDAVYKALPECCYYRSEVGEHAAAGSPDTRWAGEASINSNSISGIVLEQTVTKTIPLAGASLLWLNTETGTVTNNSGHFQLLRPAGSKQVVISFAGFSTDTIELADNKPVQIILQRGTQLKTVVVRSIASPTSIKTNSAIRSYDINSKELLKAACCNLSESFETNPSVDVAYNDAVTGSKQIQLLGLAGNYTQLTVENLPGPRGLATSLGLNSIPGTWVDGLQLIKGTGSVINGFESIAGQINVELKKPDNSDQLYANVYANNQGKNDINLNLTRKLNTKWSTALLLHDAFATRKTDMNNDNFRDMPTGNLFSGLNRWSFADGKGLFAQFGVKYLNDKKTGGEMSFDPQRDKFSTNTYGLQINIDRKKSLPKLAMFTLANRIKVWVCNFRGLPTTNVLILDRQRTTLPKRVCMLISFINPSSIIQGKNLKQVLALPTTGTMKTLTVLITNDVR